jgi:hypothetical protein
VAERRQAWKGTAPGEQAGGEAARVVCVGEVGWRSREACGNGMRLVGPGAFLARAAHGVTWGAGRWGRVRKGAFGCIGC